MPKHTFYDLKSLKKEIVFKAAINEFASYSYDESNITRIVKASGIARGSFYQYFEDKEDLYLYILEEIGKEKRLFLSSTLMQYNTLDLFEYCRAVFRQSILFAKKFPEYKAIGELFQKRPNQMIKAKLLKGFSMSGENIYELAIKESIKRGELRDHFNAELLAKLLVHLSTSVMDEIIQKEGYEELDKLQEIYEELLEIIKKGVYL